MIPIDSLASISQLPLAKLEDSPTNPRKYFEELALDDLADSIKLVGLTHPILVRPLSGERLRIVCGHRRVKAARLAGLEVIAGEIRELSDHLRVNQSELLREAVEDLVEKYPAPAAAQEARAANE